MTERYPMRAVPGSNTVTAIEGNGTATPPRRQRCKLALAAGSAHLTQEIACLLRRRLRVASLIALAGFAFFLLRAFWANDDGLFTHEILPFQLAVVAVLTLCSSVLWSHLRMSMHALRWLEAICFGAMAFFFGYVQVVLFNREVLVTWANPDHYDKLLSLAAAGNALRWTILIVLYGTFIPNTWRRCAAVVGTLAAIPFLLMAFACAECPVLGPYLPPVLFEMTMILAMAASIAIFGSYKVSALHQEAFEARKLGQYVLRQRLGAGGMGEVYLGEHMLLRRACAIKLIHPKQADDPTITERFEREVRAMATLTHWNTVEVYDYGRADDGTFYYVMEYLPGLSLQELVDRHGPLPPGRAVHFLRQICAALQEAHSINLIHRDIKPSNVIACQRGGVHDVAKLLDFGLVQRFGLDNADSKLTVQGAVLGSPQYISPEQARTRDELDARTDIYSVGGLAYFLLTGRPPFVRDTPMELMVAHVHEPVTPPVELRPELPLDLQDVVLRCLRKDPALRFADVQSLDEALASCACADHWDRDQAAEWWQRRTEPQVTNVVAV